MESIVKRKQRFMRKYQIEIFNIAENEIEKEKKEEREYAHKGNRAEREVKISWREGETSESLGVFFVLFFILFSCVCPSIFSNIQARYIASQLYTS